MGFEFVIFCDTGHIYNIHNIQYNVINIHKISVENPNININKNIKHCLTISSHKNFLIVLL